ncbi:MAG: biotin/lipoyl-binding protein [Bacteroidetes bacterium]|jgi:biotin carboxyl carrier protein|nr:biotin/lipoyl-binding protein [Bacteroidota bacterium]
MRDYVVTINGTEYRAELRELNADSATVAVNGVAYVVELKQLGIKGDLSKPAAADPKAAARPAETPKPQAKPMQTSGGVVKSPLPGLVLDVVAKVGDQVKAGQKLMVLETMKMENHIPAPFDGVVKSVLVHQGETVSEGQALFEVSRPDMTTL